MKIFSYNIYIDIYKKYGSYKRINMYCKMHLNCAYKKIKYAESKQFLHIKSTNTKFC